MKANKSSFERIARLELIELAWHRLERASFYHNPSAFYRALCDLYEAHGTPFGGFERGLKIWFQYNQGTTTN